MNETIVVVGASCLFVFIGLAGFKAGFKLCELVLTMTVERDRNKHGFLKPGNITVSYIGLKK